MPHNFFKNKGVRYVEITNEEGTIIFTYQQWIDAKIRTGKQLKQSKVMGGYTGSARILTRRD